MENQSKSFFAPSKIKAAIGYIISIFLLGTLFTMLIAIIVFKVKGIDYQEFISYLKDPKSASIEATNGYLVSSGWANLFAYICAFICVFVWMKNDFIQDYKGLLENKKKYAIITPIFAIGFVILAIGIDHVFSKIVDDSSNQQSIVDMMKTSAAIPLIIATVFLAPIVEEMIYRKAIFSAFKNVGVVPAYITSIVLFTIPHMLSTSNSIGIWLLQCVPYALCATMLCFIYHKSKYNIYVSITAHMLNNLLAVLLVLF